MWYSPVVGHLLVVDWSVAQFVHGHCLLIYCTFCGYVDLRLVRFPLDV